MTPHRAPHEPRYTLRRVGDRLERHCAICINGQKLRWKNKNREKVRAADRARHYRRKVASC